MKNIDRVGGRLNSRISLKYNTFYRLPELKGSSRFGMHTSNRIRRLDGGNPYWTQSVTCKLAPQQFASVVLSSRRFFSRWSLREEGPPKKKSLIGKQKKKKKGKRKKREKRGETSFRCPLPHCSIVSRPISTSPLLSVCSSF